jgi:hypothetical protein
MAELGLHNIAYWREQALLVLGARPTVARANSVSDVRYRLIRRRLITRALKRKGPERTPAVSSDFAPSVRCRSLGGAYGGFGASSTFAKVVRARVL